MSDYAFSSEEDLKAYIEGELERLETVTAHQPEPEEDYTLGGKAVADVKKRRRQQIRAALRHYDEDDDLYLDLG